MNPRAAIVFLFVTTQLGCTCHPKPVKVDPGWQVEVVAARPKIWQEISVARGADGEPAIAFEGSTRCQTLVLAFRANGAWDTRWPTFACAKEPRNVLASSLTHGVSVAADKDGGLHFAGYGSDRMSVEYARLDPAGWTRERIADTKLGYTDGAIQRSAIAIEANGTLHVAFLDANGDWGEGKLVHAWRGPDGWHREIVEEHGGLGVSIALGPDGTPHLAYVGDAGVRYAQRSKTGWNVEAVMDSRRGKDDGFFHVSLAIDAGGRPHVAFDHRGRPPDLRIDVDDGGHGYPVEVSTGRRLAWEEIKLGWLGWIEYARRDDSGWHLAAIDRGEGIGYACALGLDPAGQPIVAYSNIDGLPQVYRLDDNKSSSLIVARLQGGSWSKTVVESGAGIRVDVAVTTDSAGAPLVAYGEGNPNRDPAVRIKLARPRRAKP